MKCYSLNLQVFDIMYIGEIPEFVKHSDGRPMI